MTDGAQETSLVDVEVLELLKESLGKDKADTVIAEFFVLVQQTIAHALEALEKKDYETFAKYCHQIKSNISYIGGKDLEQRCVTIERAFHDKNFQAIEDGAEGYKQSCAQTIAQLGTVIETPNFAVYGIRLRGLSLILEQPPAHCLRIWPAHAQSPSFPNL